MIVRRAGIAVLLFLLTSYAVADVTGTWSGGALFSSVCDYTDPQGHPLHVPFSGNVAITLSLLQSSGLVNGIVEIDNIPNTNQTCQLSGTLPPTFGPLSGTISGSSLSLTATFLEQSGPAQRTISATVSGTSMSFNLSDGVITGTLTQTSTLSPDSALTGTYTGTFTSTFVPCGNPPSITYSGSATLGLIQAGTAVTGSIGITGSKTDVCDSPGSRTVVDEGPLTGILTGRISGNSTITGVIFTEKAKPLSATINGNTITGTIAEQSQGSSFTFSVTRSSTGTPAAAVASFSANPSTINAGNSSTLSWSTINAGSVSIDNGIGTQNALGTVTVSPQQTTTYTLTANGPGGTATATTTVTVTGAGARVIVGTLPGGMLEATGASGTTDSFTLSNVGTTAAAITLTQSGNFFTISPNSFTIPPGASQVIAITANAQPAGTYDGSITDSADGISVPVHLLVAAPPTAPVRPQATAPRSDVSAPAGQNPSGSVSFTNNGSGTLVGIAVADVPWIVPQMGAITIPPGQTQTINFNIDRTKRPDSASLNGGLAGKISLVYLTGASSKGLITLGGTPTGSVSVTIVDVVQPGVAPGTPLPLASGEVALFIDGLSTTNKFNGDLLISSRAAVPSISDLQVFQFAGSSPSQLSTIPAFSPNGGVSFPAIAKNVFGNNAGGSFQVRSSQAANTALSAVVTSNGSNSAIASVTSLPILRSDRSIGTSERMIFTGAQDSKTTVWIQEVTGNAGHVSIQYLDTNGAIVGTDSGNLLPFASSASGATNGTRSVIVTNDSTGPARLAGYAVVNDATTNDSWVLTDPLHQWGSASGALFLPLVQTTAGSQTDVYVMNPSTNSAAVTLEVDAANRHHAVRPAGAPSAQAMTIAPMSTTRTTVAPAKGFIRISGATSLSAAGRMTTSAGGGSLGSSLPAVPSGAALGNGQGKRFTGVDDSSARTIAAATPATYRSTLMLIETAAQNATVRVTLRYTFVAGATVSSQGVSSRDFSIGPNEMLTIVDLGQSIIGAQRDSFGDLRNMQVDVDVIDGTGRVLPFIETVDNGSGDIAVRAE